MVATLVEHDPVIFEPTGARRRQPRELVQLMAACVLFVACGAPCGSNEKAGDWTYVQERDWSLHGPVCVSRLRFRGADVWAGRLVVTPLGTFRLVLSEHGQEDNGWRRISGETSDNVPIDGGAAPITREMLRVGFYASPPTKKLPGTPAEWVYVGGVGQPGWVAPEKLRDLEFIRQHPPVVTDS